MFPCLHVKPVQRGIRCFPVYAQKIDTPLFTVEHKSAGRNKVIVGKRSAPQLFDDMLGSIKQIQVTEEILAKLLFARLVAHSPEYKKASLHRTFTCYGVHTGMRRIWPCQGGEGHFMARLVKAGTPRTLPAPGEYTPEEQLWLAAAAEAGKKSKGGKPQKAAKPADARSARRENSLIAIAR